MTQQPERDAACLMWSAATARQPSGRNGVRRPRHTPEDGGVTTPSTPETGEAVAPAAKNRPALVSEFGAICAIAALFSFTTVVGWVAPAFFVGFAILASLVAIVAGHVGRARGRQ